MIHLKVFTVNFILPDDSVSMENFLNNLGAPMLSTDDQGRLNEPISKEEIDMAISLLQSGKSPRPDGFPAEFFFKHSPLCFHLSLGYNLLVLKKGKDPAECSSYRPISLLNIDAKILAKVLAHRLENILPTIISDDQTVFVKNRRTYFYMGRLLDILHSPSGQTPE